MLFSLGYCQIKEGYNQDQFFYLAQRHSFQDFVSCLRALRMKLLTNERLTDFGMETKNCVCYIRSRSDTTDHNFVEGKFANFTWKYFAVEAK